VHADKGGFRLEAVSQPLSLLKTVNYRESLTIFQRDRRPVGTRDLLRRRSLADPVWGAPRVHRALRKLGIEVSLATVGRYLTSALQNSLRDLAQLFTQSYESYDRHRRGRHVVVATATFRLLYAAGVVEPLNLRVPTGGSRRWSRMNGHRAQDRTSNDMWASPIKRDA
jgi:hypothetical protein